MLNIPSNQEKNYLFLKSRYLAEEKGIYGLFYIMFEPKTNYYEKLDLIASHFKAFINEIAPETNWPTMNWSQLEDIVNDIRYKQKFTIDITKDLKLTVEKTLQSADIEFIIPMVEKNDIAALDLKFHEIFRKSIGDTKITFNFNIEKITSSDIELKKLNKKEIYSEEKKALEDKLAEFEQKKHQIPQGSAVIDVSFVLSPVSGIPINELKVNDMIMLRIDTNNTKGRYFADLIGALRGQDVLPIPASVYKIEKNPIGEYFVLAKIQDGIYGRISETEQVKIRRFDPDKDELLMSKTLPYNVKENPTSPKIDFASSMKMKDKVIIFILGGALILLIILVFIFYYVL
ncbi:MAG: hypothetical protein OEV44_11510 [Spirochaetota bacterium]|nr:hypothetical protein [Spirochaetota bacterium]